MRASERGLLMMKFAAAIRGAQDELVELESLDSGKPVAAIRRQDLPAVLDTLVYYAGMADKINGQVIPTRSDALTTAFNPQHVFAPFLPGAAPDTSTANEINIKVQRVGGLWNAKRMHDAAREAGLPCWLGTMPELGIATSQSLMLASLDYMTYPTDVEASDRWFVDDIISPTIEVNPQGNIILPDLSPMGYAVDMEKLERYTIKQQEFRR